MISKFKVLFVLMTVLPLFACDSGNDNNEMNDESIIECENFYEVVGEQCEIVLTDEEQILFNGLSELKLMLNDPSSLEVHRAFYHSSDVLYGVVFDFSAENALGGMQRYLFEYIKYNDVNSFKLEEPSFGDYEFQYDFYKDIRSLNISKVMAKLNE